MGKNWFTVERIDADTFAISEEKHWEETHCYLLCGRERALLIDTGLGVANIRTVAEGLTFLPITVAATHAHWDHIGGHKYFAEFAVHEAEKEWLSGSFPLPLEAVKKICSAGVVRFPKNSISIDMKFFRANRKGSFMTAIASSSETGWWRLCIRRGIRRDTAVFMRRKEGTSMRAISYIEAVSTLSILRRTRGRFFAR